MAARRPDVARAAVAQPPTTGLFKVWGSGFVDPETSPDVPVEREHCL